MTLVQLCDALNEPNRYASGEQFRPADRVRVGESGYRTREDLEGLERAGADAALVGESLLRSASPGDALRALLSDEPASGAGS